MQPFNLAVKKSQHDDENDDEDDDCEGDRCVSHARISFFQLAAAAACCKGASCEVQGGGASQEAFLASVSHFFSAI